MSIEPAALLEEAPMSAELLAYYRSRVAASEGDIVDLRARIDEIELSQARAAATPAKLCGARGPEARPSRRRRCTRAAGRCRSAPTRWPTCSAR